MAPRTDGKQISAGFAVFLISFLVLETMIVFAGLLLLSYENMYTNLIDEVEVDSNSATTDLANDIAYIASLQNDKFEYTLNDDGSENFKNSRVVDKFVNSYTYHSIGAIYITDGDGQICCRKNVVTLVEDSLQVTDDVPQKISQENVLNMLSEAKTYGQAQELTNIDGRIRIVNCVRITGTDYFCIDLK